jgi:hypothetical protein
VQRGSFGHHGISRARRRRRGKSYCVKTLALGETAVLAGEFQSGGRRLGERLRHADWNTA